MGRQKTEKHEHQTQNDKRKIRDSADNINKFLRYVEEHNEPSKKDYPLLHIDTSKQMGDIEV